MVSVAAISQQIWDMKYRLKGPDGAAVDKTIEDSWARIAGALAAPERDAAAWAESFTTALTDFKFLPAGRIVAGAGTGRTVTLFNCFVMGTIPDDMSGIFTHLREAALTMQQGGGILVLLGIAARRLSGMGEDGSGALARRPRWRRLMGRSRFAGQDIGIEAAAAKPRG